MKFNSYELLLLLLGLCFGVLLCNAALSWQHLNYKPVDDDKVWMMVVDRCDGGVRVEVAP